MRAATISTYENGHTFPGADYLMRAADLGVDTLYVLTGRREADLGDDHLGRLVTIWPRLPNAARVALTSFIEAMTGRGDEA